MKLRTVIVDDEHIARQRLRRLLAREAEIEIIAECGNAAEALTVWFDLSGSATAG